MSRCVIIAAFNPYGIRSVIGLKDNDFIICADGGYDLAYAEGIEPDVVIGDFDSIRSESVSAKEVIRFPSEKDDTDTMLCLKHGLDKGYKEFIIVGGIGGRFDHTLANIQTLSYACDRIDQIRMINQKTVIAMMSAGEMRFSRPAGAKYISLFSMSDKCSGVSISGVKYPLDNTVLTSGFPLGVSNEFTGCEAVVRLKCGKLLIVIDNSNDNDC